MIVKDPKRKDVLLFVANEEAADPDFLVRLELSAEMKLRNDLKELTDNQYFLEVIDRKLSHIFTVLHLFLDNNRGAIERIEGVQQEVYDQTWKEIVANSKSMGVPN